MTQTHVVKEHLNLSLRQRFTLRLLGEVYFGMETPSGATAPLPMYVVKCSVHGLFKDTPHGFEGKMPCRKCVEEGLKRAGLLEEEKS